MPAKHMPWTAPPRRGKMPDCRSARIFAQTYPAYGPSVVATIKLVGGSVVKLTLRDKESAQEAVRRFRKLVERSGIKKEMRVREFYEKPSETKRRARLRAQRRARRDRFIATH
jgi:small subunit ribosomal protein S21